MQVRYVQPGLRRTMTIDEVGSAAEQWPITESGLRLEVHELNVEH